MKAADRETLSGFRSAFSQGLLQQPLFLQTDRGCRYCGAFFAIQIFVLCAGEGGGGAAMYLVCIRRIIRHQGRYSRRRNSTVESA